MTTWEIIAAKTKELPTDKQQQILNFVEFVRARTPHEEVLKDMACLPISGSTLTRKPCRKHGVRCGAYSPANHPGCEADSSHALKSASLT
jgi:hypothetical protein